MKIKLKKIKPYAITAIGIILTVIACKTYVFRSNYNDTNSLIHAAENLTTKPFLKAHLRNGEIFILRDSWQIDSLQNFVSGFGTRFDYNRNVLGHGNQIIPIDSVAIFETNHKLNSPESGRIAALSILAGLDVILGIICLTNPKACFGSCPTFYINKDDDFHFSEAEGFSDAILPSMEYYDIDALSNKPLKGNQFSITMKKDYGELILLL